MYILPNTVLNMCRQAGLNFWISSKVAMELNNLENISSKEELNQQIIKKLKEINADAAAQFEDYYSVLVRTSQNTLEGFERSKISDSLVKETKLAPNVAEEISKEVESHLRQLRLKNLSSSLIREIVNAKLIEKGLIDAKLKYTRIGLPIYDISQKIEKDFPNTPGMLNRWFGDKILQEYVLTKVLPKDLSESYLNGEIYIHHLEDFITYPISFKNDLAYFLKKGIHIKGIVTSGPPKHADVVALHAARILLSSKDFVGGGVCFDSFNVFIAPFLYKKTKKEIQQISQNLLYELNKGYYEKEAFSINFCTKIPKNLKKEKIIVPWKTSDVYEDYEDESITFMEVFLETLTAGDYAHKEFKWPRICIKYKKYTEIEKLKMPKPCYFIQRAFEKYLLYGNILEKNTGVLQTFSINLPKLSEYKTENKFFSKLEDLLENVFNISAIKKEIIEKRFKNDTLSFLNQEKEIKLQSIVSFYGMQEFCKKFLQTEEFEKNCMYLAGKILRFTKKKEKEFAKEGIFFSVGENFDQAAKEHFSKYSSASQKMLPENIDYACEIQKYCDSGAFFEIKDRTMLKNKDFLFFKLI
jgi:anaerobic ribonucleoside-triphosphate reductase